MNDCVQLIKLKELTDRIIELEKADIKIQAEVNSIKSDITDLTKSIDEVKFQMEKGFNRVSSIVFRAMTAIIGILLTILGALIYNYFIVGGAI